MKVNTHQKAFLSEDDTQTPRWGINREEAHTDMKADKMPSFPFLFKTTQAEVRVSQIYIDAIILSAI